MIEVGSLDVFFDDEPGYRISTDTSALPEIRFEADEAAVLGHRGPGVGAGTLPGVRPRRCAS